MASRGERAPTTTATDHEAAVSSLWIDNTDTRHPHYSSTITNPVEDGVHNSVRSEATGLGLIPVQPGEMDFNAEHERSTSAPPPGLNIDPGERNRLAEELIWGPTRYSNSSTAEPREALYKHPSVPQGAHSLDPSSFTNLAEVLGSGLAASMEAATHETQHDGAVAGLFAKDDLNFHRQTRHAANRLVGNTPSATSNSKHLPLFSATVPADGNDNMMYARAPGAETFGGFPSSLSSPARDNVSEQEQKRQVARGATTPVEMIPGQAKGNQRRNVPPSKDIGMNVVEPEGDNQFSSLPGIVSKRMDNFAQPAAAFGSQQYDHIWSLNAPEFRPTGATPTQVDNSDGNSSISDSLGAGTEISAQQAENELKHFLWDIDRNKPSRTLAILHVSWLRAPDVRNACEAYGALDGFRSDFSSKGIYFVSYYDVRSAQLAAVELQSILQRMLIVQRSSEEVIVRYCLALNASSQFDDSQIAISELPPGVNEHHLASMLASYGAVRSVMRQGVTSFLVEFQSVQDAKQALLELDSSQPWGPNVMVEMGVRNPIERKRGRELLGIISRWRGSIGRSHLNQIPSADSAQYPFTTSTGLSDPWRSNNVSGMTPVMGGAVDRGTMDFGGYGGAFSAPARQSATPQLVLGPDGRYQVVMQSVAPAQFAVRGMQGMEQRPPQQQIVQGPDGQLYVTAIPVQQTAYMTQQGAVRIAQGNFPATISSNPQFVDNRRGGQSRTPYYTHVVASDASTMSARSYGSAHSSHVEDKDNRHLMMDLEAVEAGVDSRTSLMVRNIPNKYTQQMLLAEFEEHGHGPGIIDFFYLPIDFKNKCNRGYAFINFVDYKDILPFHRRYFGKHWRTFNSDKICDITYARIQGKAAMLKRFENSALMEKDDEYKPLVFVSDGPNKGQRLPFPGPLAK